MENPVVPASFDLLKKLIMVLLPAIVSGVGVWTWQRAYFDYQLERQRADWELRQSYERRESQRKAMEQTVAAVNEELETFITAAALADSTIYRVAAARKPDDSAETIAARNAQVSESIERYNEAEKQWLVRSRVLLGEVRMLFDDEEIAKAWDDLITTSQGTCDLFYTSDQSARIQQAMLDLRQRKDALTSQMSRRIDRFVQEQLEGDEPPPSG